VTKLSEYRPVVPFTGAWSTVARTLLGLYTRMNTAELGPGAGEICPVTWIVVMPAYEGASVCTEMV
jgi:hypothetical protein